MTDTLSDTRIDLRCPTCGWCWNVAAVISGVWWARGVTPAAIAALCWCPYCHAAPPMEPAPPPRLFMTRRPVCPGCGRQLTAQEAAAPVFCEACYTLPARLTSAEGQR